MRVNAYFVGDIYKEIYMALKKKADTLIHFITYFIRIQFFTNVLSKVLPELHNLKVLNLDILDYKLKYQLNISRFQHLEVLQTGYITIDTVNCLIKSSGGCLKKILIGDFETYNDNLYDDSLLLIRTVRENCPLIECLSLVFITSDDHFIELERLLRTCQYLKVLILETIADFDEDETITYEQRGLAGEKLLNVLIKSTPINLSVIGIFDEYFSINILGEFLENWRGRQALSILTSNNEYENEEFAKLIDKYKEEGVIKKFSDSDVQSIIDNYGI
ncbi:4391_t:CDS:1 [Funneliformis mosseae]|uniref:4391_t:CDS:1 n=1 Tax=Funneliformis mosseae TaxID=27381 RepID=A0A9N9AJP6_FUNMO|nr:4391_t:CDS:1 [Funneliformis mosseae]